MASHVEDFEPFYSDDSGLEFGSFKHYLSAMAIEGEFGDDLVLNALARAFKVTIRVLVRQSSGKLLWSVIEYPGQARTIKLFFDEGAKHYENLLTGNEVILYSK